MAFLDTKLLGKPPSLHGKQGEYADWAYITRRDVCLLDPQMDAVLTAAANIAIAIVWSEPPGAEARTSLVGPMSLIRGGGGAGGGNCKAGCGRQVPCAGGA